MRASYDVIVAGGSIAGLLCAREIASAGYDVLVAEEDYEIGTPEHCGGLVSNAALCELGIIPFDGADAHRITRARITSPDGSHHITLDAKRQKVTGVSRRDLDKQIAHQAQKAGAVISTKTSVQEITDAGVRVSTHKNNSKTIECRMTVDARGAASLAQKDRTGIMPSAQYEVYADWIEDGTVEIIPDHLKYPGFFAWVIPSGRGRGRVGVAGAGINVAESLDAFLAEKDSKDKSSDSCSVIRRIFAPIWLNGPIKKFHHGTTVIVGDAAGQAKPTTAGGIFSSGMGGIIAGRTIAQHLVGDMPDVGKVGTLYRKRWLERFGREFKMQIMARKILARADNEAITGMIKSAPKHTAEAISKDEDFDFHASALVRLLGATGTARMAQNVIASEMRNLVKR